jgi:hypothetical protein
MVMMKKAAVMTTVMTAMTTKSKGKTGTTMDRAKLA